MLHMDDGYWVKGKAALKALHVYFKPIYQVHTLNSSVVNVNFKNCIYKTNTAVVCYAVLIACDMN